MPRFYCKYCGTAYNTVTGLTSAGCSKSPTKKHVLYEGGEKKQYTCQYCGSKMNTISGLVATTCAKSPTKHHFPA